jgi:hypothetical protein
MNYICRTKCFGHEIILIVEGLPGRPLDDR